MRRASSVTRDIDVKTVTIASENVDFVDFKDTKTDTLWLVCWNCLKEWIPGQDHWNVTYYRYSTLPNKSELLSNSSLLPLNAFQIMESLFIQTKMVSALVDWKQIWLQPISKVKKLFQSVLVCISWDYFEVYFLPEIMYSKTWLQRPPRRATTRFQRPLFLHGQFHTETALQIATTCLARSVTGFFVHRWPVFLRRATVWRSKTAFFGKFPNKSLTAIQELLRRKNPLQLCHILNVA